MLVPLLEWFEKFGVGFVVLDIGSWFVFRASVSPSVGLKDGISLGLIGFSVSGRFMSV